MRLGTYKGIHMTRPNTEVTKHEVLNVLKKKQKEYAVATNIDDRSAQEGDQGILDFQGMYHGQDIPHGNGSDFALTIGAKAFLPEFDDALIGKNIGDTFDINVTFPTDYRISTMQNRSVVFHTTLKKIRLMDYQPIDDEFAKDFSEYTTLNEWENEIFSHLQARRKTSVQEKLTREVMTKIIADSDIPIDDDMKEEIRETAGLEVGDTIFFIADNEKNAALYAGQIRTALGERLDLIEKNSFKFCYINDFPMYEYDKETKKMEFTHNPFSMPQGGLEALETMDPEEILAYQYDIVCNGVELSSGAVRNHDMKIMVKAFEIAGYTEEDLKEKFGALYNAFQFGAPPHAGMAPGVDRMIMLLRDEENIREVIPFPMNGNAQDLMCGAPGEVTEQQLREVHIKVRQ